MIDIKSIPYNAKYLGDLELFLQDHPLDLTADDINGYAVLAALQLGDGEMSYGKAEFYLTEFLNGELRRHWKEHYDSGLEIYYGIGLYRDQSLQLYDSVKCGGITKALVDLNKAKDIHDGFKLFYLKEMSDQELTNLLERSKMPPNKENDNDD